jgi:hypothetical protein
VDDDRVGLQLGEDERGMAFGCSFISGPDASLALRLVPPMVLWPGAGWSCGYVRL